MTLRDLATCPAATCSPGDSIADAARLMTTADIGFVVVVDEGRPVGVLTDRDIVVRAVAAGHGHDTPVHEVMTRHATHVDEHDSVEHAASVMADKRCRRLPVTDATGRVIGVLSLDDLLSAAGAELGQIARAVRRPRLGTPVP